MGLNGWPLTRLYFWLLPAAMSFLAGLQLLTGWFIMRALEELNRRDVAVASDLHGKEIAEQSSPSGISVGQRVA